jgi:hypothetical protein
MIRGIYWQGSCLVYTTSSCRPSRGGESEDRLLRCSLFHSFPFWPLLMSLLSDCGRSVPLPRLWLGEPLERQKRHQQKGICLYIPKKTCYRKKFTRMVHSFLRKLVGCLFNTKKARRIFRALIGVINYYLRLLHQHALFRTLAAVAAHLSPTALIFLEAGGTIAAVTQVLHQPPLFLEATRCTATRFMSCHRLHPLSSGGFYLESWRDDNL